MTRCACAVLAIAAACGKGDPSSSAPPGPPPSVGAGAPAAAGPTRATACEGLPFAGSTPVPEASGGAWLAIDGKLALVVASDSGHRGAYGLVDPETGATGETGALPLSDEAGDDLEGLAARGDRLYGLTSSGWIRVWRRKDNGFALIDGPYPLGPIDLPDATGQRRAPMGDGMVCDGRRVNCGRNYEGLCLAQSPPPSPDACVGFAASKADGHLYCLTEEAGRLAVHRERAIAVTRPRALADCAFGDDGTLWAASNLFDLGHVYRVAHWDDLARARVERVGALGAGFPEVIAARGEVVYRMSDAGGAPSLMFRYRCGR